MKQIEWIKWLAFDLVTKKRSLHVRYEQLFPTFHGPNDLVDDLVVDEYASDIRHTRMSHVDAIQSDSVGINFAESGMEYTKFRPVRMLGETASAKCVSVDHIEMMQNQMCQKSRVFQRTEHVLQNRIACKDCVHA